jgi:ABC-type transport system involved in multi-copper enzyme maturation permease subunit
VTAAAPARGAGAGVLGEVFRFEVEYRVRQPSTWVYALVLVGMPFLLMHVINGSSRFLNAPVMVMQASTILGALGMLVTAGVFGDAASRDVQARMHALFYTSPLRPAHYLVGRFLGALLVNAVLVMGIPLGLLLASVMPYMEAGKFGPVHLAAYVQTYALMLLPNVVVIGAFMFAAAALTRQALATYLGGVALFVLGTVTKDVAATLGGGTLQTLLDPFGGGAITQVTQYWTPAEQNARLIGWPAVMLANRALWIGVAALAFALLVARFRFAFPGGVARRPSWRRRAAVDTAPDRLAPVAGLRSLAEPRSFGVASRARQTIAVAARAWREVAATKTFLLILAGAMLFVFATGWDVGGGMFGDSTWPVTHLIAGTVLGSYLPPVMALLIAVLAGDLVWREREVGLGDVAAIAPIPDGVALLGRFLALVAMLVALQAAFMAAGMILQAMQGWTRFEPLVYLKLLFGIKLVDYVLLAALAMTVHVVVNHKYVGHLIVVVYFASTLAAGLLGITNSMLVFGSDPGWSWSDLNGLAPFLAGLVWFKLYWAAWALLLAVVASLFWVRGRELGARRRLALARQRLRGGPLGAGAAAIALIVGLGGFLLYNTRVLNAYQTPDDAAAEKAEYERRYKRFEGAPMPDVYALRLQVELYPSEGAAEVAGTYRLVNREDRAIDSLHVLPAAEIETRDVRFDRGARLVVDDSARRYRVYALERPLAPGDSIAMHFRLVHRPRGFRNAGAPTDVTANGTYIHATWMPVLGYAPGRELWDETARREHGLPPRVAAPSAGDVATQAGGRPEQLATSETIVGTDAHHTAVAVGTLVREWTANGRRYFHYRTAAPTRLGAAVLSAAYAVRRDTAQGVRLAVYHHPGHDVNVDRMLRSMRASLAYFGAQFGPYPSDELRVVEFPLYAAGARAHPHTIAFSEGSAFLTRNDSGAVDRTFFVVAHETAHQWWGGQVIPASAPGAGMVSETLAQYSATMVLETTYGQAMARDFVDFNMKGYLSGRGVYTNREVPLLDVVSQSYVYYYKGAVAMYTLRERLGADAVNGALRRFREKHGGPGAPAPTSRALYAELQAVTPDSLRPLLADLFEHITLWDVRADSAHAEPDGAGAWRVTLHVDASKARADSIGRQTPIAMDDLVEIGVFADGTGGDGGTGEPLYLKPHRIRGGRQTITVTVPRRPARAGIDPRRTLIEREREDNVAAVADRAARRGGA